jgi:hypothetical protein
METGRAVMFFLNSCKACSQAIEIPVLSDFDGDVLYQTEDMKHFAIVDLYQNPAMDLISQILHTRGKLEYKNWGIAQRILCDVAEPIGNQRYIEDGKRCPLCGAKLTAWSDDVKVGMRHLPSPQWNRFMALDPTERERMVESMIDEYWQ